MAYTRRSITVLASALLLASAVYANAQTTPNRSGKAAQKQAQLPPAPAGPLSQLPMDQIPAAPPQVSYERGMLTIIAQNSTLADILTNVRKVTGAAIDVPPNASERVVTRIGPGPARDVLAALLNGTSFNYVMSGSAANPDGLSAVWLSAKPAGGVTPGNPSVAMVVPNSVAFAPPEPAASVVVPGQTAMVAQTANQATADADDDSSDDDADDDSKPTPTAQNDAGQQDGLTPEQLHEQMKEKSKLPPNAPRPLLVAPEQNQ